MQFGQRGKPNGAVVESGLPLCLTSFPPKQVITNLYLWVDDRLVSLQHAGLQSHQNCHLRQGEGLAVERTVKAKTYPKHYPENTALQPLRFHSKLNCRVSRVCKVACSVSAVHEIHPIRFQLLQFKQTLFRASPLLNRVRSQIRHERSVMDERSAVAQLHQCEVAPAGSQRPEAVKMFAPSPQGLPADAAKARKASAHGRRQKF